MAEEFIHNIMAPDANPNQSSDIVDEEKLDSRLKNYIAAIVKDGPPYSRDIRGDRRHIETDIMETLPKLKGWEPEVKLLHEHVHEFMRATAAQNINAPVIVRLTIASHRLVPERLPEPNVRATILVCDSVNGIKRQCNVPATPEVPRPLEHMGISSGLILVGQLMPGMINERSDMRAQGMGSGIEYAERNTDKIQRGDVDVDKTGVIRPDLHKKPSPPPKKPSVLEEIAVPLAAAALLHNATNKQTQHQAQQQQHGDQQHLNRATGLAGRVALGTAPTGWEHTSSRISAPEHIEFFVPENAAGNLGEGGMFNNAAAFFAAEGAESVVLTEKADEKAETEELQEDAMAETQEQQEDTTENTEEQEEEKSEETTEEEDNQEAGSEQNEEAVDGGTEVEPESETVEFEEEPAEEAGVAAESASGVEAINDAIEEAGYEARIEPVAAEKETLHEEQVEETKTENKKEAQETQQETARDERREERTETREDTQKAQHENRVEGREDRHDLNEEKDNTQGSGPDNQHAEEPHGTEQKPEQRGDTVEDHVQEELKDRQEETGRPDPRPETHAEARADMEPNRYEQLNDPRQAAGDNRIDNSIHNGNVNINTHNANGPERPVDVAEHLMMEQRPSPGGTEFHQTRANFNVDAMQPNSDAAPNVLNISTPPSASSGNMANELMTETAIHHLVSTGAATPTLATPTQEGLAALAGTAGIKASTSISRGQMQNAAKQVRTIRAQKNPQARPGVNPKTKKVVMAASKPSQAKPTSATPPDPQHILKPGQDKMG